MDGVKWGEQEMWGASAHGHGSFTPPLASQLFENA